MKYNLFRLIAIILGVGSILASVIFDNSVTVYIKPFFHVFLYIFFLSRIAKFNVLLFMGLTSVMVGESLVALGFMEYYHSILLLFSIYFFCNSLLLYPVVKDTRVKRYSINLSAVILGVIGFVVLISMITLELLGKLPDMISYGITAIFLFIFIGVCFFIHLLHGHPKDFLLFLVGISYFIVCSLTIVYEVLYSDVIFLGLANFFEVIAQVAFVSYVTAIPKILSDEKRII